MCAVYGPALKYSGNYSNMDSSNIHTQHHEQQQQISGLLRYRSAPSSLLTNPVGIEGGFRSYVPSLGEEMEGMLDYVSNSGWSNVKNEEGGGGGGGGGGSVFCNEADKHIYDSHQGFQEFAVSGSCSSVMMNNTIMGFQNSTQFKMAHGNYSNNLLRQKTSPPGIFSNFSLTNAKLSSVPSSTCSRRMPQIAENGNENLEQHQEEEAGICVESRKLRNDYMPSFTGDFWEGTSFAAQKTASDSNEFVFSTSNASESQPADQFGYYNVGLTHQMSLPNSSTKKDGIETILHIQGSVPCKIRAKRGFATHPRSIAERVRRTRISERIKKLQDLFPKSDKQTNTADMLDLTVDYIKDLQKQVKILTDTKAKCICFQKQRWS